MPEIAVLRVTILVLGAGLGAAVGSFAGVLVERLQNGGSVWGPPSFCANCHTPIAVRDNVPVISWLLLRGHCRDCGASITLYFFILEVAGTLAGGVLAAKLL